MNMVIPNEGKAKWLDFAVVVEAGISEFWFVRLYQNDYTPINASTPSDFVEADFTGYNPVTLARSDFSAAVIVANVAETVSAVTPVYACTAGAPQTVYGWFMVGSDYEVVYAAQRFDTPRVMSPGAVETLDPFKIKLKTFA